MISKDSHNDNPFSTPKTYFEGFEERLFQRNEFQPQAGSTHGFEVPNDYFETIEDSIFSKLESSKNEVSWFKNYWHASAIAAILVIGLFVFNIPQESTLGFDDINVASIEDYLDDNLIDLDDDDISALINNTSDFSFNYNIEEDAILDYLDVHLDDTSLITE